MQQQSAAVTAAAGGVSGVVPGDRSDITRMFAHLVGTHVSADALDRIEQGLAAWGDEHGKRLGRGAMLNLINLVRDSARRPPLRAPAKRDYTLASLVALPAHTFVQPQATTAPPVVTAPVATPAPVSAGQPIPQTTVVYNEGEGPPPEIPLVELGTLVTPKQIGFGRVLLTPGAELDLAAARETYMDEYMRTKQHPFLRLARIDGKMWAFAGSSRGPYTTGKLANALVNVAFRVGGKTTQQIGASFLHKEDKGGISYWIYAFPWEEGLSVRWWINVQRGAAKAQDLPEGRAKAVMHTWGFLFTPNT